MARSATSASSSSSIADTPSSGNEEWAARPAAWSFNLRIPRVAAPRRLSVGSPLTRNRAPVAAVFASFAPSLPRSSPTTNTRPTRVSPSRVRRSSAATCAARMPLASHAPRPYSRSPSTRLGKNGGTQSKWVDSTTSGWALPGPAVAITLPRSPSTVCSITANPSSRRRRASQRPASPSRPVVESMSMRPRANVTGSTLRAPCACRSASRGISR